MSYSNEWLQFRKAEDVFFDYRQAFMQNKETMISDLKAALLSAENKETALRFLLGIVLEIDIIILLISKVLDLSIDSSNENTITLSRSVVYMYKDYSEFKTCVINHVRSYYTSDDDWHFRRIAELYKMLGYEEELASFVKLCQANANPEIQEIGDDFYQL